MKSIVDVLVQDHGVESRSMARRLLACGQVTVNGQEVKDQWVEVQADQVELKRRKAHR